MKKILDVSLFSFNKCLDSGPTAYVKFIPDSPIQMPVKFIVIMDVILVTIILY